MDETITQEDRLALYFQTLPGDLPERYAGMGEEFARGCHFNLEGDGEAAMRVFEGLSADTDNDILNYEKAISIFTRVIPEVRATLLKAITTWQSI
jgi:hypothetical protein